MDLGTTISRLWTAHGMSQGDLAEALDVSRQSVSKWETGASVPELEKLVKLAQLFEISLDELVTGQPPRETESPPPSEASPPSSPPPVRAPHRIAGIVLLSLAGLLWLLLTILSGLGGFLAGLMLAVPFLACGIVCLRCHRRAELWCAWIFYLCVELYIRWGTGIRWTLVFLTPQFTPEMNYMRLAMAWVQLAVMLGMLLITIRSFRTVRIDLKRRKNALFLALGWSALVLLRLFMRYVSTLLFQTGQLPVSPVPHIFLTVGGMALLPLFATLLTVTVCGLPSLRSPSSRP